MMPRDVYWMDYALSMAKKAALCGEVPVGAAIVQKDTLISVAYNQPISQHDPSAHAEILALRAAATLLGNYRLSGVTLYVTLEPCMMCIGAMVHARIGRLVYGANDPKSGAADCLADSRFNHRIAVTHGVMAEACGAVLKTFFREKRRKGGKDDNSY